MTRLKEWAFSLAIILVHKLADAQYMYSVWLYFLAAIACALRYCWLLPHYWLKVSEGTLILEHVHIFNGTSQLGMQTVAPCAKETHLKLKFQSSGRALVV